MGLACFWGYHILWLKRSKMQLSFKEILVFKLFFCPWELELWTRRRCSRKFSRAKRASEESCLQKEARSPGKCTSWASLSAKWVVQKLCWCLSQMTSRDFHVYLITIQPFHYRFHLVLFRREHHLDDQRGGLVLKSSFIITNFKPSRSKRRLPFPTDFCSRLDCSSGTISGLPQAVHWPKDWGSRPPCLNRPQDCPSASLGHPRRESCPR